MLAITCRTLSIDVAENDTSTLVVPSCGIMAFITSKPSSTIAVASVAATYMPVPQARPIAAVTQSPAAVVSPRTTFF